VPEIVIEVYFDYISPFAYLASELLDRVAERCDASLRWKPIELLALSNFATGLPYTEAKRAYVGVDVLRTASYHEVPIKMPDPFPVRSRLALCAALVALDAGRFEKFHRTVFRAAWREQQDIGSEVVLAELIAGIGIERPDEWLARAQSAEIGERLASFTAEAESRGVFGVPTAVVEGELFWGVDSFPVLEWRLRQTRPG
jgi:2-hydroxychromene-2-carboxylate isomerase